MAMALVVLPPCGRLTLAGVADSVKPGGLLMVSAIVALLLELPDVPVTVTVDAPLAAELLALKVSVLVPAVPAGLKDAVTPVGRPDAARATVPAKPFCGFTVMVLPPLPPCATVALEGDAESVKLGGAVMVRLIVVVSVRLPEVPVTVRVDFPAAAEADAAMVSALPPFVVAGLKVPVTPLGRPEIFRLTSPLNPFCWFTVTVLPPLPPGETVTAAGAAESVKEAAPAMVRLNVVVALRLPEVPVIVSVDVPGAVEAAAMSVRLAATVEEGGVKLAVTPAGRPEILKLTVPLNPFCGATPTVAPPAPPAAKLVLPGDVTRVKEGGGVTVSEIVTLLVMLPDVPVTVTVAVVAAAALVALSVRVLVVAVEPGLKVPVTPDGRPLTARLTDPLNPLSATVMVLAPLPPGLTLRLEGAAESVKPGGVVIVSVTVVLTTVAPEVPETVTVAFPMAAFAAAVNVSALLWLLERALKDAVTPVGSPDAARVTVPLKPVCGVIVMVLVPVAPSATLTLAGDADSVKVGAPGIVRVTVVVALRLPEVPVTVMV